MAGAQAKFPSAKFPSASGVLLTLALANAAAFGLVLGFGPASLRRWALQLAVLSLGLALLGVPAEWIRNLVPNWGRPELIAAALALYALVASGFSRNPVVGVAAGITVLIGLSNLAGSLSGKLALQLACVTTLAHSLRWALASDAANRLRWFVGAMWLLPAYVAPATASDGFGEIQAVALLGLWLLAWRLNRHAGSRCVPIIASGGLLDTPLHWLLAHATLGMFALAGSFALFGCGAWHAWRRSLPNVLPASSRQNSEVATHQG